MVTLFQSDESKTEKKKGREVSQKIRTIRPCVCKLSLLRFSLILIRVNTTLCIYRMDADKTFGEKVCGNYKRMQRVILNKSWKPSPMKQQLYDLLLPIS